MTDKMKLTDVNGELHFLNKDQVRMMLTIGWLSFFTSWLGKKKLLLCYKFKFYITNFFWIRQSKMTKIKHLT